MDKNKFYNSVMKHNFNNQNSLIQSDVNLFYTNDGSVGLYNPEIDDIFHSVYGAREEAETKFIRPLNFSKNFSLKDKIRVLDICYGIGYNTKALLKRLIQAKYKGKISIDILENNKELVLLSPFINDTYFNNYPEISYILLNNLCTYINDENFDIGDYIDNSSLRKFISPFYRPFNKKYKQVTYTRKSKLKQKAFLHNIYYHCISQRYKKPIKRLNFNKIKIKPYFDDARITIKALKVQYDIIFLDAFTPTKLPTLWSLQFFKELYRLIKEDGMLVTYSNSAAVRHAMIDAGFCVGKVLDNTGRNSGTVAAKRIELIENKLSDYDMGLLDTSAGIYYLDENLDKSPDKILDEHLIRKNLLNLKTSTQYKKDYLQIMEKNKNGQI